MSGGIEKDYGEHQFTKKDVYSVGQVVGVRLNNKIVGVRVASISNGRYFCEWGAGNSIKQEFSAEEILGIFNGKLYEVTYYEGV
jgi:hypothetical protein